jgi:tetratricopeptide (TPR) repeat protein
MVWNKVVIGAFVFGAASLVISAEQEHRPKNVPFYTWVREDTFAGFMSGDMTRFERGMQKTEEYLREDPGNMQALDWKGAGTVYRAVRAFNAGDEAKGDELFREAVALMDKALAAAPQDPGVRATTGGTLAFLASQLPERYAQQVWAKVREHYTFLYRGQEPQLEQLPLHLKGETLAGIAEAEFRLGNRDAAQTYLNRIVAMLPNTGYARTAQKWLSSPESVTRSDRLTCQSCHEQGLLSAWKARNTQ